MWDHLSHARVLKLEKLVSMHIYIYIYIYIYIIEYRIEYYVLTDWVVGLDGK